jgi:hypothetical protein
VLIRLALASLHRLRSFSGVSRPADRSNGHGASDPLGARGGDTVAALRRRPGLSFLADLTEFTPGHLRRHGLEGAIERIADRPGLAEPRRQSRALMVADGRVPIQSAAPEPAGSRSR